jgi:NAD+ kinase
LIFSLIFHFADKGRLCCAVPCCFPCLLACAAEMELRVPETARVSAWVCFDGKARQELHHGDSVFIKMSENPVPTINRTDLTTDW